MKFGEVTMTTAELRDIIVDHLRNNFGTSCSSIVVTNLDNRVVLKIEKNRWVSEVSVCDLVRGK